ncbi:MAG TPA: DUF1353 domain-containing protein [Syntrophales bacterium]|nr:DUF1353 domain-containing protein [Syntrophales bacterium]
MRGLKTMKKNILTSLFILLCMSGMAYAQLPIPPPVVKPFADSRDWMLVESVDYSIGNSGVIISVPKGFVTDFASIPQPLWSFGLSPYGRFSKAAIVHDYLYWMQNCTREQADNLLLIAMKESGVSRSQQDEIYLGVRAGGETAWESNRKDRAAGLIKIIPSDRLNFPYEINWPDYRKQLLDLGVKEPSSTETPAYCSFGDSKDVP